MAPLTIGADDFDADGPVPADAWFKFRRYRLDRRGPRLGSELAWTVTLDDGGNATTELPADQAGNALVITSSYPGFTQVTVAGYPEDVGTLARLLTYEVDPATLRQSSSAAAAWSLIVARVEALVATAVGHVAAAAASAAAAARSALGAADSASSSGTSAFNAGQSAATALGHANDAAAQAREAVAPIAAEIATGRLSVENVDLNARAAASSVIELARFAYNAKPAQLQKVRAKLGSVLAGAGQAKIAYLGHSMVAGTSATPGATDWPTQFAKFLERDGYARGGDGFIAATKNTPDARVVAGAGWMPRAAGSSTSVQNTSSTNTLTFQTLTPSTAIDVYYAFGLGPFTVSVDGGAPVTPSSSGAGFAVATISGLPSTVHTVTITRTSGTVVIYGIDAYSPGPCIRHYNLGVGGQSMLSLASTATNAPSTLATSVVRPDLVFLECIHNDASAGVAVATWKTNARTTIARMLEIGATVVLLTDTPVGRAASVGAPYVAALYELARENGIMLIDMLSALDGAVANGLIAADNTHPMPAGYAAQARAVFNALAV